MKKKKLKQKINDRLLQIERKKEIERIEARVLKLRNDRFVLLNRRLKIAVKLAHIESKMTDEQKKLLKIENKNGS